MKEKVEAAWERAKEHVVVAELVRIDENIRYQLSLDVLFPLLVKYDTFKNFTIKRIFFIVPGGNDFSAILKTNIKKAYEEIREEFMKILLTNKYVETTFVCNTEYHGLDDYAVILGVDDYQQSVDLSGVVKTITNVRISRFYINTFRLDDVQLGSSIDNAPEVLPDGWSRNVSKYLGD